MRMVRARKLNITAEKVTAEITVIVISHVLNTYVTIEVRVRMSLLYQAVTKAVNLFVEEMVQHTLQEAKRVAKKLKKKARKRQPAEVAKMKREQISEEEYDPSEDDTDEWSQANQEKDYSGYSSDEIVYAQEHKEDYQEPLSNDDDSADD